ncbi:MAG: hypothetical protein JSU77_09420 [Fidelibacterota bacterium]|nr:MAG: hypothetical protein JSU77_09420 [Candidatus Neomarinimicrobiota bacterium]
MKIVHHTLTFITLINTLLLSTGIAQESGNHPPRLRRSESFLGIHFDFHADDDCDSIGNNVDRAMVEYIIDKVQPDYIQTDSKGHRGLTSYPTEVGNRAPGFVRDPLKIWRAVTAERGVALYLHHSGVWDAEAVKQYPEWARINEEGKADDRLTSVFGPYVDQLLIPQLKEIRSVYQVDGVWIDGECWATERDYSEKVIKAFREQTGIQEIPKKPDDPYWFEFSEFCRAGFRHYLDHYVSAMHQHSPGFQIASNWAYSSMMPEPVDIGVDFISGDYSAMNSVNSARFEGRCMVHQGKPWDLMAWSFTWTDQLFSTKSVPQLKQEAAMVLSLGGGFQAYFPQRRDGSIRRWQMDLMGEVAKFCRARQKTCHRAEPVPQIGLIYSQTAFYRRNRKLFAAWSEELVGLRGILQSLLESQNVVDIVMEHHPMDRMSAYPLLIYPEWEYVDPDLKADLLDYVRKGGNLLVIGPKAAANFVPELDVKFIGQPVEMLNGLEYNGWLGGVKSLFQKVALGKQAKPIGKVYNRDPLNTNDISGPYEPAGSIRKYGEGKIAAIYLNLGERYRNAATSVSRDFLSSIVRELFPQPLVEVIGSQYVDVTANRKDGKLAINLVNTSGPHANEKVYVFDEISSVGPLDVFIRTKKKPRRISLEPGGRAIDYRYSDGKISLTLPSLDIHEIIVVE